MSDRFWSRHYALANDSSSYGTQGNQPWYHYTLKNGRHLFVHRETCEERELPLTHQDMLDVCFGSKLWQNLPCLASLFRS